MEPSRSSAPRTPTARTERVPALGFDPARAHSWALRDAWIPLLPRIERVTETAMSRLAMLRFLTLSGKRDAVRAFPVFPRKSHTSGRDPSRVATEL
jgi:hypothetical protein